MRKKLPEDLRRKRINIRVNEEERETILQMSMKYHYGDNIAKYARAMCLNPNIYVEEMYGRKEVIAATNKVLHTLKEILHQQKQMMMNITISNYDRTLLINHHQRIEYKMDYLVREVIRNLEFDARKKFLGKKNK